MKPNLKEYKVTPDDGMFEQIEHRLRLRHMARIGGVAAAVVLVAVGVVVFVGTKGGENREEAYISVNCNPQTADINITEVVEVESDGLVATAEETVISKEIRETMKTVSASEPSVLTAEKREVSFNSPTKQLAVQSANEQTADGSQQSAVSALQSAAGSQQSMLCGQQSEVSSQQSTVGSQQIADMEKNGSKTPTTPHYSNLLWAPNAIIPTADDESLHQFKLIASSPVSDFHMIIYNRGGRQVFSTQDINQAWDATKDGTLMPQGTYVWMAKFRDSEGNIRQEKGTVTVIR